MSRHPFLILLVMLCIGWSPPAAFGADTASTAMRRCTPTTKLCIGVRSLARPFSFRTHDPAEIGSDSTTGPLGDADYSGYMIRICDAVLAEMRIRSSSDLPFKYGDVGIYDLDAISLRKDEYWESDDRKRLSRFENLGKNFDILCDPASLNNERRTRFITSPPLFLTGISYISRGATPPALCNDLSKPIIGLVAGTTAEDEGLRALLAGKEIPRYRDALVAYLNGVPGTEGQSKSPCKGDDVGRIKAYRNHADAAKAFCNEEIYYYVGDLEIITANVRNIAGCNYDGGTRTYTDDRYAIFGMPRKSANKEENIDRERLVARFFEILAQKTVYDPSLLDKAYKDTFGDATRSRKLELFYWSVSGAKP